MNNKNKSSFLNIAAATALVGATVYVIKSIVDAVKDNKRELPYSLYPDCCGCPYNSFCSLAGEDDDLDDEDEDDGSDCTGCNFKNCMGCKDDCDF